jgi:hypothetical protein
MISFSLLKRCNFRTDSLRELFGMFPRLLKRPMGVPIRSVAVRAILKFLSKTKTLAFCSLRKFWKSAVRMLALPHFANPA